MDVNNDVNNVDGDVDEEREGVLWDKRDEDNDDDNFNNYDDSNDKRTTLMSMMMRLMVIKIRTTSVRLCRVGKRRGLKTYSLEI